MIYRKNVPSLERRVRVGAGLLLAIAGFTVLQGQSYGNTLGLSGAFVVLTGFFGFCPACAMVGRKLKSDNDTISS
ncbi:MAG: DUF2892 domain-containing protein [Kordiimonadaceae bacterium]|nr:DUF2892 domain-containing protein [Kordiimonadaceae bacterium]MBO6569194.1 DUF2892 domain-containing protein [Kordiimonadaceae bacterium]MBO6964670.1 DUF2892 domain-containing protein [Kordiimonadaceae bacterium]